MEEWHVFFDNPNLKQLVMKNLTQKTLRSHRPRLTVVRKDEPVTFRHLDNSQLDNPEIIYPEIKMPKHPTGYFKAKKHDPL